MGSDRVLRGKVLLFGWHAQVGTHFFTILVCFLQFWYKSGAYFFISIYIVLKFSKTGSTWGLGINFLGFRDFGMRVHTFIQKLVQIEVYLLLFGQHVTSPNLVKKKKKKATPVRNLE